MKKKKSGVKLDLKKITIGTLNSSQVYGGKTKPIGVDQDPSNIVSRCGLGCNSANNNCNASQTCA